VNADVLASVVFGPIDLHCCRPLSSRVGSSILLPVFARPGNDYSGGVQRCLSADQSVRGVKSCVPRLGETAGMGMLLTGARELAPGAVSTTGSRLGRPSRSLRDAACTATWTPGNAGPQTTETSPCLSLRTLRKPFPRSSAAQRTYQPQPLGLSSPSSLP
jgi:hypothetical protein